jgi:thioredoxin 1
MAKPITVNDQDFEAKVLKSPKPVVVDFWAQWCPPCRLVAPVLEELSQEYGDRLVFAKLNVDENPATSAKYSILSIPTLILFKEGKPLRQWVGFRPKAELQRLLEEAL